MVSSPDLFQSVILARLDATRKEVALAVARARKKRQGLVCNRLAINPRMMKKLTRSVYLYGNALDELCESGLLRASLKRRKRRLTQSRLNESVE